MFLALVFFNGADALALLYESIPRHEPCKRYDGENKTNAEKNLTGAMTRAFQLDDPKPGRPDKCCRSGTNPGVCS